MKLFPPLLAAVVFGTSLGFLGGCKPKQAAEAASEYGWKAVPAATVAPEWKLKTVDGAEVSSAAFKGKIVIVDFWATWCGPCVGEIPGYIALQKKFSDRGVTMVGISVDRGGPEAVKPFLAEKGVNYPVVMNDDKDEVIERFGMTGELPTTYIIDRQGRIVFKKIGSASEEDLEKIVETLLKS